jgi:hypothetical protein
MAKTPCGAHVDLASNDSVRITRCGCGTVHLTLLNSGVTVRISAEQMRGVLAGMKNAAERLEDLGRSGTTCIN